MLKLVKIGQNGQKWSKKMLKLPIMVKIVKNGQNDIKWSKIIQNGPKWSKWSKIVKYGKKNGPNGLKCIEQTNFQKSYKQHWRGFLYSP